jgi:hypothetical protein
VIVPRVSEEFRGGSKMKESVSDWVFHCLYTETYRTSFMVVFEQRKSQWRRLCNMKVEPGSKIEVQAECGIPLSDHEAIKWQILNQDPLHVRVWYQCMKQCEKTLMANPVLRNQSIFQMYTL